jgi:hypothetical protein
MKVPKNRKGFAIPKQELIPIPEVNLSYAKGAPVIYGMTKLSHTGVTSFKVFEGFSRKMHKNSLSNLINQVQAIYDGKDFETENDNTDNVKVLKQKAERSLNNTQSRKVKKVANKLGYYSRVRTFVSRKTGSYKFKVAFLTLTVPSGTTDQQSLKAFEHFLDYLRRTANCHYVWKKELGDNSKQLHYHIMINNFIPFYLVSWKWKRLLLQEGVKWQQNEGGKDTDSHTRIELPRSRKLVAHYIAKYMSKAYSLPRHLGYITGYSSILDELKDVSFIEGDIDSEEILDLQKNFRTIKDVFLTHVCCDLRKVQRIAPSIYFWFIKQFESFQEQITLPQKYYYV